MSQDYIIRMQSPASTHVRVVRKNKKKLASVKLEMLKYDPVVRKRVKYKEIKWKGKGG